MSDTKVIRAHWPYQSAVAAVRGEPRRGDRGAEEASPGEAAGEQRRRAQERRQGSRGGEPRRRDRGAEETGPEDGAVTGFYGFMSTQEARQGSRSGQRRAQKI